MPTLKVAVSGSMVMRPLPWTVMVSFGASSWVVAAAVPRVSAADPMAPTMSRPTAAMARIRHWLPDRLRDRFAPHVRAYMPRATRRLFRGLPVRIRHDRVIYPGFDKVTTRHRILGRVLRKALYAAEHTPFHQFGLSHFVVARKLG